MNSTFKSIVILCAIGTLTVFSSCKKEEKKEETFAKPTISGLEVGENNSGKAKIGDHLHLDAEVVAEGKIDKITVDLHPESGSGDDIEAEYTNYSGLKNADFHQDLDIPSTAAHGDYHLHLKVIDQKGQSTTVEAEVHLD